MAEPAPAWRPTPLLGISIAIHLAGLTALLVMPSQWLLLGSVLIVDHALVVLACLLPRCSWIGPNLTRLPARLAEQGCVALTFDDGPDPQLTRQVLAILARYDAVATFFCVGQRAARYPELIAEIVRNGHRIENHSYQHANLFSFLPPSAIAADLQRCQQVLAETGGQTPTYFRAPAGIRNPWVDPILSRHHLRLVSWTRRGFDTIDKDPTKVAGRLLKGLAAGDILLLHDGGAARTTSGRPVILEALPVILEALRDQGLRTAVLP